VVAEVPAASLANDAPLLDRPSARPGWLDDVWSAQTSVNDVEPVDLLLKLLDDPAIGSSAWVHEQYDHMLFLSTVIGPGSDGSLLRMKGTDKALAVSTDGNGRLCYLDPLRGAARLVYEAALNVAVAGARPLAVVDNLNFGNPEKPEVMWQLIETVEGISGACEALGIPVVGGNVSFYNETDGVDIHPTPVVGLLGLADPMPSSPPRWSQAKEGMEIWEVGPEPTDNLAGSAAQRVVGEALGGRPTAPSPERARRVVTLAADLAHLVPVLHDISDGGLAVAVAEICIASGVGARINNAEPAAMFSEDPHRFVVVMESGTADLPADLATRVGIIGGDSLSLGSGTLDLSIITNAWRQALPSALGV
jgi:phosphoribosylformylglycinamidine synthase